MMNLKRLGWGVSMSPGYDQAGPHFGFVFSDRIAVRWKVPMKP